jgi:hypothetical protein
MMTNELKKKLGLYSLASGAIIAMTGNAEAQGVVYNDIPDNTVSTAGGSYLIDLNGDASNDFTIILNAWTGSDAALYIKPISGAGSILGQTDAGFTYVATPLGLNTTLKASPASPNVWGSSAMMAVNAGSNYGKFKSVTDKYIGLRLKVGADYYYGWVRVDVDIANYTFVVKDFAYNSDMNTTIKTGQITGTGTTTAVEQSQELDSKTIVFVNEQNEISVTNNTGKTFNATLMNINGNQIGSTIVNDGTTVLPSQGLVSGMYLVKITMGEALVTKRMFVR